MAKGSHFSLRNDEEPRTPGAEFFFFTFVFLYVFSGNWSLSLFSFVFGGFSLWFPLVYVVVVRVRVCEAEGCGGRHLSLGVCLCVILWDVKISSGITVLGNRFSVVI